MSKRNAAEVLFPIVDVKIEEDEDEDPLEMINEEQFDNPKTRQKVIASSGVRIKQNSHKKLKKEKHCKNVAAAAVPINIISCARLDLEMYEKSEIVYKLKCTHCANCSVLLKDWKVLVKHLENQHSSIVLSESKDENGVVDEKSDESFNASFASLPELAPLAVLAPSEELPVLEATTLADNVDKPIIKTEKADSDYDDFVDDAPDDDDYVPDGEAMSDDKSNNGKPKKRKFVKSEDDEDYDEKSNYKKNDQIITFTRTDKEIVLGFLEMLKLHPLLWHRRQSIITRYDRVLVEMAAKFHAKFPNHQLSTNDMRLSIYRIKKLYDKAVSSAPKKQTDATEPTPKKQTAEAEATFKTKFPKYFEMCCEIEEESKKMAKKCDSCFLSFIDEIDLQVHAFQMHRVGELPFKCNRCNRRFANEAKLAYHEKKDHAEQQFPCLICDKSFDKESRLHSHMSLHVGAKQICEICGKSFDSSYRYRRHMLHHAPPQFKCELCGKMLYEKYTLSEHMKTHYNQRNYACEICGKTFNINNGLQIHRRQVHKVKTQYVWGKKTTPASQQASVNSSPTSNMSVIMNTPASVEMTAPSTEQNSLLEAPAINPPLIHNAALQDRLINDLLNLQQLQQQQQQQLEQMQQQQLQQQQQQPHQQQLQQENQV